MVNLLKPNKNWSEEKVGNTDCNDYFILDVDMYLNKIDSDDWIYACKNVHRCIRNREFIYD